jgi:hypothetical protein
MYMTVTAEWERTLSDLKETLYSTHASPEDFFTVTKTCINEKEQINDVINGEMFLLWLGTVGMPILLVVSDVRVMICGWEVISLRKMLTDVEIISFETYII